MDETILLPSPNWFLVSNLAVSSDGWVIYGGPSKSLCVLEPKKADIGVISGNEKYQAHVVTRAHPEKIVSVDISPEWLDKRSFLSGDVDGCAKQWMLEIVNNRIKVKATHSHSVHQIEKEAITGIGYSTETIAISVGCFGNIVKWELPSNVAKTYPNFLKNLKPTCMSCSRHMPLNVAIGTKQGVVFVLDLHGNGKVLYKVRGHDDEVMNVSWCPQYEITVNKTLDQSKNRSFLTERLEAIKKEGEKELALERSAIAKSLPDDSFDESIVQEDDMFDIYKDHEPDEFGHKKYEPEEVFVKVKEEKIEETDYLAECLKLKEDILMRKNQAEPTIESLVQALDKTHVDVEASSSTAVKTESVEPEPSTSVVIHGQKNQKITLQASNHIHKHLLATIGKYGGVRIWSKSGKLVGTCAIPNNAKNAGKKIINWPTLLWYKPDSLLIADGKSQLLECNPLIIDCKNKLEWRIVHALHKRGMYAIASNAPRVQTDTSDDSDWSIWTISQDRKIIKYCLKSKKALSIHGSCGGFLYNVQPCPYDAGKVAVGVGDGAVRVWECSTVVEDESKLTAAKVTSYWQNVQGKVLTVAWHPTKENLLAFATAEARVGLIDTSGKCEKPARVLLPALNNAVYSVCWGEGMRLYASGGGALVVYASDQPDQAPETIDIILEGQKWAICSVMYTSRGLICGSCLGAVAVLSTQHPYTLMAATFVFTKMIHAVEWHPQQTSSSSEESKYKDLIAVCSLDKENAIIILEFGTKEDGQSYQLTTWKTLSGHKSTVLQLAWNPHQDGLLLSTSQDSTVRIWDISSGTCIAIFGNHSVSAMGAAWVAWPQLPHHVMSGGGDASLRLWDIYKHKAEAYDEKAKHEVATKKQVQVGTDKKDKKTKDEPKPSRSSLEGHEGEAAKVATSLEASQSKLRRAPKRFMLPVMFKQINDPCLKHLAPKKMLELYLQKAKKGDQLKFAEAEGDGIHNTDPKEVGETTIDEKGDAKPLVAANSNSGLEIDTKIEAKEDTVLDENCKTKKTVDEKSNSTEVEEADDEDIAVDENGAALSSSVEEKRDMDFLKVFGSIKEVNEYLDLELDNHMGTFHSDAWIMLQIFRGNIDTMIQFASQHDLLCPFLLSMAPCVSFKYWKDATQLYLAQIDRLVARGEEDKLIENRWYGGPVYRKATTLLSIHDVKGAVAALIEGKLFKEAYILCRLRYMDSVAEEILDKWANDFAFSGNITISAVCYIALGNLSQAATILSRSKDKEILSLAADIAKIAGRNTFADHVVQKATIRKTSHETPDKTEEILKELPSKIELLMKENQGTTKNSVIKSDTLNGETLNGDTIPKE